MNGTKLNGLGKPHDITDRAAEWETLAGVWRSRKPELAMVLGRRRAGKSYLLTRFAKAAGGIYYQATRRTEQEQLTVLSRVVGEHLQDSSLRHGAAFPDWETLLTALTDRATKGPILLVLDEFPDLANSAPALTSILQSFWDHQWHGHSPPRPLKLVLAGSHITAMRRLEAMDQPLYGRRTARIDVAPFPYQHVQAFVPEYSLSDCARTYGIIGGLPGHLALLDPGASLGENVAQLALRPSGRLFDDAPHMLDTFLGEADVHYSIISAIAGGAQIWSKITSRLGKDSGSLSRPMRWLEAMQIVRRNVPITESATANSKRARYAITDPHVAFWHRFVAPLAATGAVETMPADRLWRNAVAPGLDQYMGGVFEEMCRAFVWRAEPSVVPFTPMRVGSWWDAQDEHQIDLVAMSESTDAGVDVLVGECKWGMVDAHDLAQLRERVTLLRQELPRVRDVTLALFSANGLSGKSIRAEVAAKRVLHYSLEDLYRQ